MTTTTTQELTPKTFVFLRGYKADDFARQMVKIGRPIVTFPTERDALPGETTLMDTVWIVTVMVPVDLA